MPKPVSADQLLARERLNRFNGLQHKGSELLFVTDPHSKDVRSFSRDQVIRISQTMKRAQDGTLPEDNVVPIGLNSLGRAIINNADLDLGGACLFRKGAWEVPDRAIFTVDELMPAKEASKDFALTMEEREEYNMLKEAAYKDHINRTLRSSKSLGRSRADRAVREEEKLKIGRMLAEGVSRQAKRVKRTHAEMVASAGSAADDLMNYVDEGMDTSGNAPVASGSTLNPAASSFVPATSQ